MHSRILIVTSSQDTFIRFSELSGNQYQHVVAHSFERARQLLGSGAVTLLFADTQSGQLGDKVCRYVKSKSRYQHIPVIAIIDESKLHIAKNGYAAGADLCVAAEVGPEILRLQMANLLQIRLLVKTHLGHTQSATNHDDACLHENAQFLQELNSCVKINLADQSFCCDGLAALMQMSRPTFYRRVKAVCNLTPKAYIDITRLRAALELIAQNDYKIFEIAAMVGYGNSSVFHKVFRRYLNTSPLTFKKSLKAVVPTIN